jgi:hypothetical protein
MMFKTLLLALVTMLSVKAFSRAPLRAAQIALARSAPMMTLTPFDRPITAAGPMSPLGSVFDVLNEMESFLPATTRRMTTPPMQV